MSIESDKNPPEITSAEVTKAVANQAINEWQYGWASEKNVGDKPSLGRIILDCLNSERVKRNELEMLELIEALRQSIKEQISEQEREIQEQVKNAQRHLDEAYEEYKNIEQI